MVVLDDRGRTITEFDRSPGSLVRDILVALRSELSPVRGKKAALAYLGVELDPDLTIETIAARAHVGQGGRIPLTFMERAILGHGDPLADTEVVDQIERASTDVQRASLADDSTQVIRRSILPRLEERRSLDEAKAFAEAKTEVIREGKTDVIRRAEDPPGPPPGARLEAGARPTPMPPPGPTPPTDEHVVSTATDLQDTVLEGEVDAPPLPRPLVLTIPTRMRRGGTYPLRVAWGPGPPARSIVASPRLPGCVVTPAEDRLPSLPGATLEFWITPIVSGPIPAAAIVYHRDGREIGRTAVQIAVRDRRAVVAALIAGLLAPWLGLVSVSLGYREAVSWIEVVGWGLAFASFALATALYARTFPQSEEKTTFVEA